MTAVHNGHQQIFTSRKVRVVQRSHSSQIVNHSSEEHRAYIKCGDLPNIAKVHDPHSDAQGKRGLPRPSPDAGHGMDCRSTECPVGKEPRTKFGWSIPHSPLSWLVWRKSFCRAVKPPSAGGIGPAE